MRIQIPKRENPNLKRYHPDDLKIAYRFTGELKDELEAFAKAVVIFGSAARKEKKSHKGDIDILVVVDDITLSITPAVEEAYRIIVQKIINRISPKLHIITIRYTSFWEYIRNGDPVGVNILRDGVALFDTGFFEPLQGLLERGRIRPSQESIWNYFIRAPNTLHNSKWHIMQATLDLYWAVIDSAHAALMKIGEVPPTPEHVADLLEQRLVRKKLLERKYAGVMRNFYKLMKMITYREIREVTGDEYEKYYAEASGFVNRMKKFIEGKV